jgi:hypothetical protein
MRIEPVFLFDLDGTLSTASPSMTNPSVLGSRDGWRAIWRAGAIQATLSEGALQRRAQPVAGANVCAIAALRDGD